ncbi:MAG TPA: hypothetical protein VM782_19450 [Stellaceae bacterium]|nr:hypothetical protein [Stellaceae bacterium]
MSKINLASLLAAGALIATAGVAVPARAQIAPPPDRVEVYHYYGTPKADPGDDPANWSARQNVVESDRYEWLTHSNPAFRAARIRRECGPITEPDLYQQCVASFY